MPTFGTRSNPAHWVEIPDPLNPGQSKRPEVGAVLKARTFPEGVALNDITIGEYGYWDAVYDTDAISVSADGGINWVGPLFSVESLASAASAGATADEALSQASEALATAQEASTASDDSIAGILGDSSSATRAALSNALDPRYDRRYTRIDVVADHGADPSGGSSSVAAVNAAIARANTVVGKVEIVFPPGLYDLTAGVTQRITNNHVHVFGGGMGVTTLKGQSGTVFGFGNGSGTVVGGGVRDLTIWYPTPDAASRFLDFNAASSQKFRNIFLDNVRQFARLGQSGGGNCAAPSFRHIYGATDPTAGSVVIDAVNGLALSLNDVVVNAKGVGFPADATTPHPAQDTTFLRFGNGGSWDTVHAADVITNRYNRGLDVYLPGANNFLNAWFVNCVFDYGKTNGIRLRTENSGANIRSVYFTAGWAVAVDGYAVELSGTAGTVKNVYFTNVVGRQSGKCNWRVTSGPAYDKVTLTTCHGLGANRLAATNTGSDQDDLVILASGVTVTGGSFGEDGSSYTGFTNQARYGVTIGADVTSYKLADVDADGVTGGFQIPATNSAGSTRRMVTRNRCLRASSSFKPEYATSTTVTAPTSNTTQTHVGATVDTLHIYGGTVSSIQHNGLEIGTTGPTQITLRPGDTWLVIYTAAPTIKRVAAP